MAADVRRNVCGAQCGGLLAQEFQETIADDLGGVFAGTRQQVLARDPVHLRIDVPSGVFAHGEILQWQAINARENAPSISVLVMATPACFVPRNASILAALATKIVWSIRDGPRRRE